MWEGVEKGGGGGYSYGCVATTASAANVLQALDIEVVESAQVSLNAVFVDLLSQLGQLFLTQLPRALVLNTLRQHNQ